MDSIKKNIYKFNQDNSYFISLKDKTYTIIHTDPIKIITTVKELEMIPDVVELYYKTNIILVVEKDTLYLIDDEMSSQIKIQRNFNGLFSEVHFLKARRDKFYVLTNTGLYCGNIPKDKNEIIDLKIIEKTSKNFFDCTTNTNELDIIAYVSETKALRIVNFNSKTNLSIEDSHNEEISCIKLNNSGTILASGSEKGMYIRTWRTDNGELFKEFYNDIKKPIKLICFNTTNTLMVAVIKEENYDTIMSWEFTNNDSLKQIIENNKVINESEIIKNHKYQRSFFNSLTRNYVNKKSFKKLDNRVTTLGFTDTTNLHCLMENGVCYTFIMINGEFRENP